MKWLWNWLFPKRDNVVRPFAHVRPGLAAVITEFCPDLLEEFNTFGAKTPAAFALWLDEHFPRTDTRWGLTSYTSVAANLRHYLETANVGR